MRWCYAPLVVFMCTSSLLATTSMAVPASNSLTFGGKAVAIDMTSCSPENSADGKSRAIAAINSPSASNATIQFSSLNPASGAYTTVADEDSLKTGNVIVAVAGNSFGGAFMAKAGQKITMTKTGSTYFASFSDIALIDIVNRTAFGKMISGSFSCQ